MGKEALSIGADTLQFFTRNPRGGNARALDEGDVARFLKLAEENHFGPLVAHAPYTLNACAADEKVRDFAFRAMTEDLQRLEFLPGNYYNFHPGSHVGQGAETGIRLIGEMLNRVLHPEQATVVLLETMAGKGSEVGRTFEELRAILDLVKVQDKIGVCLDTCHIFDGGYDLAGNLDGVLEEFDKIVGLSRLKAVHLNDSMNPLGSHKDRHAKIGEGYIGLEALVQVVNHPALQGLPICLETPNDLSGYAREIQMLRKMHREGK